MGSGKTSVGEELGKVLGFRWIDLDQYIESQTGQKICEIFNSVGEKEFRQVESSALRDILCNEDGIVLSLGGGTILNSANAALIKSKSICFYLKASAENLATWLQGCTSRPLLKHSDSISLEEHIKALLKEREGIYESNADFIIDVNNMTYNQTAELIRKQLVK